MSFANENLFRAAFQRHASPTIWCPTKFDHNVVEYMESRCSNGRADWVWANLHKPMTFCPYAGALLQQPVCSRILTALHIKGKVDRPILEVIAGIDRRGFRKHLRQLLDLDLVKEIGESYSVGKTFHFPKIEICSFEFKLRDWRRALKQAMNYRAFSNRVYVVLPEAVARNAATEIELFQHRNIGLISFSSDLVAKRIVLSKKRRPSSTSSYLRAIGELANQNHRPALKRN